MVLKLMKLMSAHAYILFEGIRRMAVQMHIYSRVKNLCTRSANMPFFFLAVPPQKQKV
jgi:hypothetical protein